jgi:hypothetical protein
VIGTKTLPKSMGKKLKISPRLLLAAIVMIWSSGCASQRHVTVHWQTAVLVRPTIPEYKSANEEPEEMPDLQMEIPATPKLASVRMVPARPRVAASQPAESSVPVIKPQEQPLIAPQLSAEETEVARRITQQSLDVAERNLSATRGRNLNATQSDLASKVRGFMDDAKEAMGNVDWTRARTLANKAEVLSQELARTL